MATGFTRAEATSILESVVKGAYVALSTTTPAADGSNFNEPSGTTGYQRQEFGTLDTSILGQVANSNIIFLFEAVQDVGSVTYVGLSTGILPGDPVFLMVKLPNPVPITAGYVPLIRPRKFIIGLDKSSLESYG